MSVLTRNGPRAEEAVTRLKALADGKRLRIVALLAGGERCVCHLQEELDVAQPLLSFHLKKLKEAGLVTDRRDGRWVHYSLDREALDELREFLSLTPGPPSGGSVVPNCRT
jgi:ArsR family transcriptional regulator, arsenate/arsenite/antimonite-responsive transcriptional repressor